MLTPASALVATWVIGTLTALLGELTTLLLSVIQATIVPSSLDRLGITAWQTVALAG
jgi:hypothetical protein